MTKFTDAHVPIENRFPLVYLWTNLQILYPLKFVISSCYLHPKFQYQTLYVDIIVVALERESLVGNGSGYQWTMSRILWAKPRFCRNAPVFLSDQRIFLSWSRHAPDRFAKMVRFKLIYRKYNRHSALNCAQKYPGYGYWFYICYFLI